MIAREDIEEVLIVKTEIVVTMTGAEAGAGVGRQHHRADTGADMTRRSVLHRMGLLPEQKDKIEETSPDIIIHRIICVVGILSIPLIRPSKCNM
ncbi:hypothetical protein PHSY_004250 [Pseudozyma hubeiensis SY62]|uniref:Uncharacterized protein n=1 Tax=Pseudozyma hubeiensis (strain SY62) TaxID=1305764 RepID=R9P5Z2_PSEHS|nr:hypothetical protein PHSY_004250 [Pseudozyma hubeiensis SY62]GAC96667.1 hypothetical protein PHSY_004250 [Pseudozyma hubeiensis SY62]